MIVLIVKAIVALAVAIILAMATVIVLIVAEAVVMAIALTGTYIALLWLGFSPCRLHKCQP